MDFKSWSSSKTVQIPQFKYWVVVLELELLAMLLIRFFREANFELYFQCRGQLVPWMFALAHLITPDGSLFISKIGSIKRKGAMSFRGIQQR